MQEGLDGAQAGGPVAEVSVPLGSRRLAKRKMEERGRKMSETGRGAWREMEGADK